MSEHDSSGRTTYCKEGVLSERSEAGDDPAPGGCVVGIGLTAEEIKEIQRAIAEKFSFLAGQFGNREIAFGTAELRELKARGLVSMDVTPGVFGQPTAAGGLLCNPFLFGRLRTAMDRGSGYDAVLQMALYEPVLRPDERAMRIAEEEAGGFVKHLGGQVAAEFTKVVVLYFERRLEGLVRDRAAKKALGQVIHPRYIESSWEFESELYHRFGSYSQDWKKISTTVLGLVKARSEALMILEKWGPTQLVCKRPLRTACRQCRALYLEADGVTPKTFEVGAMLAWGTNLRRKRMPSVGGVARPDIPRKDGVETWRPTVGPVHYFCECSGPSLFTGLEHWVNQTPVSNERASQGSTEVKARPDRTLEGRQTSPRSATSVNEFSGGGISRTYCARAYCGQCGSVLDASELCPVCKRDRC